MIASSDIMTSLNERLTHQDAEIAELKYNIDWLKREHEELNRKYYDVETQLKALKFRLFDA